MDEAEKREALAKAQEMFSKFDVDNKDHSAVILLYDKSTGTFRMLTVNTQPGTALAMLDNAMDTVLDVIHDLDNPDRTLN